MLFSCILCLCALTGALVLYPERSEGYLVNAVKKPCLICRRNFKRDKFHPYQKICYRDDCRRKHKKKLLEKWRQNHPEYFKDLNRLLEKDTREACRQWRKNNPDYYRDYRKRKLEHQGTRAPVKKRCKRSHPYCHFDRREKS